MSTYINNGATASEDFKTLKKYYGDLNCLYKRMGEFKLMFTNVPMGYTQESFSKSHNSLIDKLCSSYVGKKKAVKNQSDKLIENTDALVWYLSQWVDTSAAVKLYAEISKYFSEELPAQYVDAYPIRTDIVDKVKNFMESVADLGKTIRAAIDSLRGPAGQGSQELTSLLEDAKALSEFSGNEKKLEHETLPQIEEVNRIRFSHTKEKIRNFKAEVSTGIDKLNAAFFRLQKGPLERMGLLGYPAASEEDRTKNLEDKNREKVRKKFGNIPFCDEEPIQSPIGTVIFVKKSELMEVTDSSGNKVFVKKSAGDAAKLSDKLKS